MISRGPNTAHGRGSPAVGGLPAWRTAMAVNTWAAIPSSATLSDINPQNDSRYNPNYPSTAPWAGVSGQLAVIGAWNGAVYDRATDTMFIPLAGGHTDYAGNEPYKVTIDAESTTWEMIRPPSGAIGNTITLDDGQEATGLYSDGRLRSPHSYRNHDYVPGRGPVISRNGSHYKSAQGLLSKVFLINETTGEHSVLADYTAIGPTYIGSSEGGACYDPSRDVLWHCGTATAKMLKTDLTTGVTTAVGTWDNHIAGNGSSVYLSEHDCIAYLRTTSPSLQIFDCATSLWTTITVTGSFSAGYTMTGHGGMDWDGTRLLLWDNSSNTTQISTLTPTGNVRSEAWAASTLSVAGGNAVTPSVKNAQGTWGRFRYSPRLGGCVLLNGTTESFYFFAMN